MRSRRRSQWIQPPGTVCSTDVLRSAAKEDCTVCARAGSRSFCKPIPPALPPAWHGQAAAGERCLGTAPCVPGEKQQGQVTAPFSGLPGVCCYGCRLSLLLLSGNNEFSRFCTTAEGGGGEAQASAAAHMFSPCTSMTNRDIFPLHCSLLQDS